MQWITVTKDRTTQDELHKRTEEGCLFQGLHNWKLEDFAAEDMKDEPSVSSSFYVVHSEIMKTKKNLELN